MGDAFNSYVDYLTVHRPTRVEFVRVGWWRWRYYRVYRMFSDGEQRPEDAMLVRYRDGVYQIDTYKQGWTGHSPSEELVRHIQADIAERELLRG